MNGDPPVTDQQVLDLAAVQRLTEWGGDELIGKLLALFQEHAPERLSQIRAGIASSDLVEVEKGAHSLKSSAGNLGARKLQVLSEQMEKLASNGDGEEARTLLQPLESAFEEALRALESLQSSLES